MLKSLKIKLLAGFALFAGFVGVSMANVAVVQCFGNESGQIVVRAASFSDSELKVKTDSSCAQLLKDLDNAGYIGANAPIAADADVVYTLIQYPNN